MRIDHSRPRLQAQDQEIVDPRIRYITKGAIMERYVFPSFPRLALAFFLGLSGAISLFILISIAFLNY